MQSVAFALPVEPSKVDVVRKMIQTAVDGEHAGTHGSYAKDRSFKSVRVYHQSTPRDMLVFYIEADDLAKATKPMAGEDHRTAQGWMQLIETITGSRAEVLTEHPDVLVDWHHEEGHRHGSAAR